MKLLVFDVGGTEIKYAFMEDETIFEKGFVSTPMDSFDSFADIIHEIFKKYEDKVDGIAMSLPGFIDTEKGRCNGGGSLIYNHGTDVGPLLSEKCDCKVVLENDGKAAVKAEYYKGSLKGCNNAAVFVIGTAVGGGLVIDRKVVKGRHFTAGEFSFLNTDSNSIHDRDAFLGPSCSTSYLLNEYKKRKNSDQKINGREFFSILDEDDVAKEVLDDLAMNIAVQIYNLYWLLDIEKIAIGGGISRQQILIDKINEKLDYMKNNNALVSFSPKMEMEVVQAKYGNDANLIGAYMTYMENSNV